jgi:hypothetical protein
MMMRGGRRKGRALAHWVRVLSRGELTGVDLTVVKRHGDTTEVFGYVAQDRATAVHRRAYRLKPQGRGEVRWGSPEWRPAHGFYRRPYLVTGDVNHNGGGTNHGEDQSSAVRARASGLICTSTVPW